MENRGNNSDEVQPRGRFRGGRLAGATEESQSGSGSSQDQDHDQGQVEYILHFRRGEH